MPVQRISHVASGFLAHAKGCRTIAFAMAALAMVPSGAQGQSARKASAKASLSVGPAAIIESYSSPSRSLQDWREGASLGAKLTLPIAGNLAALVHAMAFRGSDDFGWEAAAAGLELRLGSGGQIPLSLGAGIVREPGFTICFIECIDRGGDTSPTLVASAGYLMRSGGIEIGPELVWTRAFGEGSLYHSLHLGVRISTGL